MRSAPFARARAMFAAIAAIMANHAGLAQGAAIGALGGYRSRGKGRGSVVRNFHSNSGRRYDPPADLLESGQAATRRRRQIERGTLTISNGLIPENRA